MGQPFFYPRFPVETFVFGILEWRTDKPVTGDKGFSTTKMEDGQGNKEFSGDEPRIAPKALPRKLSSRFSPGSDRIHALGDMVRRGGHCCFFPGISPGFCLELFLELLFFLVCVYLSVVK